MTHPLNDRFATATQPVVADTTVLTPTDGLVAGDVSIACRDGTVLPAYRCAPMGPGPHPVVLVVQEIFGLHEHIRDVARRLARQGCLAVAPDLYHRLGDPTAAADIDTLLRDFVGPTPDAQVMHDLDDTLAWATQHGGDPARVGITGFCWGGRITWLYSVHQPLLKAGVAWYGKLTAPATPRQPAHPLDLAGTLKGPVLGLYGGQDAGIPVADVDRMNAALQALGAPSHIHLYPDAPHAFYADYRPSFRAAEAADGWQRMLAWFKQHGVC